MYRRTISFIILIFLCLASISCSILLGAVDINITNILKILSFGELETTASFIIFNIRIPRTFACVLAGAGFAISGSVIQSLLANNLASPNTIGVNTGAGLAVTISCALGKINSWTISIAAFLGAVITTFLIAYIAKKNNASKTIIILSGVTINSIFNAIMDAITITNSIAGSMSKEFRVGGFTGVTFTKLLPASIIIICSIIIIYSFHNEVDIMMLGDEMAQGLGLSVKSNRTILLILVALISGACVSFAGVLGFVGLIVPHIMRKLFGSESRYLIPACFFGGATFVTTCDIFARVLFRPFEIPVGIVISFIGGPFFLWILFQKKNMQY